MNVLNFLEIKFAISLFLTLSRISRQILSNQLLELLISVVAPIIPEAEKPSNLIVQQMVRITLSYTSWTNRSTTGFSMNKKYVHQSLSSELGSVLLFISALLLARFCSIFGFTKIKSMAKSIKAKNIRMPEMMSVFLNF